ncbi:CRISPR-associated helicase Cas3' [Palleronia caenipelagi]|uniref:CRISPR-associated helicase Cas3 n=1 Tax=Palleronia caenipelagi TaxID=2489174 RepID=A0A547PMK5_9RHOB|nr:CRISPR-associated helicase Cas3' [Palleronia caenipelagi]TRD15377.1 CRISPR-associated helicase Cas3' [Palleronia caenipelagi]
MSAFPSRLTADWPGKSQPAIHPALWHMLDVGAMAVTLCARQSPTGLRELDQAFCLLVALHDLGKISASFRALLTENKPQKWRHWEHTAVLLLAHDDRLAARIGGSPAQRRALVEAVAGHHGAPRLIPDRPDRQRAEIGGAAMADAGAVIDLVASLFPDAGLTAPLPRGLPWILNGLTVQADWIGSNPDWFPPQPPDFPLERYWFDALTRAEHAVRAAGLFGTMPRPDGAARILPEALNPRPMQARALAEPLPDGPTLTVIEDATGAGKTEAALILAARMMAAGKAQGLFFALPTMATANAMLSRIEATAPALFTSPPTLALSHGRAAQSEQFRQIRARDPHHPEDGPYCGAWLADDRRRVLLADLGVGTIDQALLSVLPTRFNALRLRALADRVLIVDEAHSYDPYMQAQLEKLLTMQARLGGSAIVLTATLPARMKAAYLGAFQIGLRDKAPRRPSRIAAEPGPYPSLTVAGVETRLTAVNPAAGSVRQVEARRLGTEDEALEILTTSAAEGAACIWIRNAVDDAIAAVGALSSRGITTDLLHARFAVCDRLRHETALQARFGRSGTGRTGRIVVATQVAEQSLDLDFDVMVSDLAPIGSLIQRAGRLWRHMDARPDRPVPGPVLHVLSPDPDDVADDRWVARVLDRGAWVYRPTEMWRSARVLFDAGGIVCPDGLRDLIERVHGDAASPVPEPLTRAEFRREGEELIERQLARNSLIDPFGDYDQDQMLKVWDDECFPTRLGVPLVTLALAVQEGDGLRPYGSDWAASEVQVSAARYGDLAGVDQEDPRIRAAKSDWSRSRAAHVQVAPLGASGQICEGLRYDAERGAIFS